jgi:hypothetical protein
MESGGRRTSQRALDDAEVGDVVEEVGRAGRVRVVPLAVGLGLDGVAVGVLALDGVAVEVRGAVRRVAVHAVDGGRAGHVDRDHLLVLVLRLVRRVRAHVFWVGRGWCAGGEEKGKVGLGRVLSSARAKRFCRLKPDSPMSSHSHTTLACAIFSPVI